MTDADPYSLEQAREHLVALNLAATYYRRELKAIMGHCGDDNSELAQLKIRVHAEEAIRAADGALASIAAADAPPANSTGTPHNTTHVELDAAADARKGETAL